VVHLTALPAPRFPADPAVLERVVAKAFNQRRKMLRAALKGLVPDIEDQDLIAAGLSPTDRAEQVPIEGFCALARAGEGALTRSPCSPRSARGSRGSRFSRGSACSCRRCSRGSC
jgi:16S rRNA A1518/A1519 N6-dimethyltransferase RsmA/KsgA/DIM1 with predicted DNA glycosylase/AP lyase activity